MDFLTTADSGTSGLPCAIAMLAQMKANKRDKSFFEMHVIGFLPLDNLLIVPVLAAQILARLAVV
jgi:hypothetical protein